MNSKITYILIAFTSMMISCQSEQVDTTKTKEKLDQIPSIDTLPVQKEASEKLVSQDMQLIADKLCNGMEVDEIFNYQLKGHGIGHYMSQDTSRMTKAGAKVYQEARSRAQCCLDATVQHKQCAFLKK